MRIFYYIDGKLDLQYHTKECERCTFIPSKYIVGVQMYTNVEERIKFCTDDVEERRPFYALLPYPHYIVRVKNLFREFVDYMSYRAKYTAPETCDYLLDPSEHEHMERYLAGTDDPMYDFVHELRHNPRALPASHELLEATERHNKRAKTGE